MRFRLKIITLLCWAICFSIVAQDKNSLSTKEFKKNNVLVLSSYPYSNTWASSIIKSLQNQIEKKCPEITIISAYADISTRSSFISDRYSMQSSFLGANPAEGSTTISSIVIIGDEGWMLYRIMNKRGVWIDIPIILCGVRTEIMKDYSQYFEKRNFADSMMIPTTKSSNNTKFTGVLEVDNTSTTIAYMKEMIPDLNEIVFISEYYYSDENIEAQLQKNLSKKYPDIKLKVLKLYDQDKDSIYSIVNHLPPTSGVLVNHANINTKKITVPVFSLKDIQPKDNIIIGGNYVSTGNYATLTSDIILKIYDGIPVTNIPFLLVEKKVPTINRMAFDHFKWNKKTKQLNEIIWVNIPPNFLKKNKMLILYFLLVYFLSITIFILLIRFNNQNIKLNNLNDKYRKLLGKYQIVYKNMPFSLMVFNKQGEMQEMNPVAVHFREHFYPINKSNFNLYGLDILNKETIKSFKETGFINNIFPYNDSFYRIIIRNIIDEVDGKDEILMIVIDNTSIHKYKESKELLYKIFNFAIKATGMGASNYNMITKERYATSGWYQNLDIIREEEFGNIYKNFKEEDQALIYQFLDRAKAGLERSFLGTFEMLNNHWIQLHLQIVEYAPEKGRILLTGLILNIDEQKAREKELNIMRLKAEESERLKIKYIANSSHEIRIPLNLIIKNSVQLIHEKSKKRQIILMSLINQNNKKLLSIINDVVSISKKESSSE